MKTLNITKFMLLLMISASLAQENATKGTLLSAILPESPIQTGKTIMILLLAKTMVDASDGEKSLDKFMSRQRTNLYKTQKYLEEQHRLALERYNISSILPDTEHIPFMSMFSLP